VYLVSLLLWLAFIEAVSIGQQQRRRRQRTACALNTLPACLDDPFCQGSGVGVVFTPLNLVQTLRSPWMGDQLFVYFLSKCDIMTRALETSKLRLSRDMWGGWETPWDRIFWRMFRCGTSCCAGVWVGGTAVWEQLRSAGLNVLYLAAWLCSHTHTHAGLQMCVASWHARSRIKVIPMRFHFRPICAHV